MFPITSGKQTGDFVYIHATRIIQPLTCADAVDQPHEIYVSAHNISAMSMTQSRKHFYGVKIAQRAYRKNITVYLYAMVPEGQYYTMRQEGTNKYKGYDRIHVRPAMMYGQ